jgi:hypothetical protein
MSGRSNVLYWLERRGLAVGDSAVDRVLATAKASNRTLTDEQILEILKSEI